jgi:hypothetical protein
METKEQREAPKKLSVKKIQPVKSQGGPFDEDLDEQEEAADDIPIGPMAKPVEAIETPKEQFNKPQRPDRFAGKKAITIVMPDGSALRRKRAADIGLSELILPPWTKGVSAKYVVVSSSKINPATKELVQGKDITMEGSYVLDDKFEADPFKRRKLMRNLGRPRITRDADGKEKFEDSILPIEFIQGMKVIDVNKDYRGYVFMELHPLNKSNRHRDHSNAPVFERVDIRTYKSDASIAAEMDLAMMAERIVMEMTDKDKILGMAIAAGKYQNGLDPGAHKNILRAYAREKPREFFKLNNNPRPAMKLNVLDAITLGIIEYREERRQFILAEVGETIFTHLVGKDPVEEFVNELAKPENAESYDALSKLVDYWE